MSSHNFLSPLLLLLAGTFFAQVFSIHVSIKTTLLYPFNCSFKISTCNATLYHINNGLQIEDVAFYYSVNTSSIKPIPHGTKQDYLIPVPCSCKDNTSFTGNNSLNGYFYDTAYEVKQGNTFSHISDQIYSGQAWGAVDTLTPGQNLPIHLLCGCVESDSQIVVTYTVQQHDTVSGIASQLSAKLPTIVSMNKILNPNTLFIDVGWVLYIPMEKNGIELPNKGKGMSHHLVIIICVLAIVTLLSVIALLVVLIRRKTAQNKSQKDPKAVLKNSISNRTHSSKNHYLHDQNTESMAVFESERPVVYSLEEIEDATNNFDETQIIGIGGYGSVYHGNLAGNEVAIKRMRSNKTKEFFAELKILCKIHHINVVELSGYASGEEYLFLVYEYIPNGSLSDHLHDPLLKGHQPLSWGARVQIALDAAKGIEYIHDHTKARYVHRDIKTSNILLDERLRAKVADFGLAKLVERTNDEDFIATRLVGTPGYLPPESVKELQVTPKTDVFAFGVVLAELITGKRALFRDKQEPTNMKSLITIIYKVFQDVDPDSALEAVIDGNLQGTYPAEDVYKMAEISGWCLREDPVERPEMREIVVTLSQILMSSVEWEASLGGSSQVFSGVFNGR